MPWQEKASQNLEEKYETKFVNWVNETKSHSSQFTGTHKAAAQLRKRKQFQLCDFGAADVASYLLFLDNNSHMRVYTETDYVDRHRRTEHVVGRHMPYGDGEIKLLNLIKSNLICGVSHLRWIRVNLVQLLTLSSSSSTINHHHHRHHRGLNALCVVCSSLEREKWKGFNATVSDHCRVLYFHSFINHFLLIGKI